MEQSALAITKSCSMQKLNWRQVSFARNDFVLQLSS